MLRLLCLLLLVLLPLQSLASQKGGVRAPGDAAVLHEIAHAEEVLHHHDDDGTIHYDDSSESLQHVDDHCSCSHLCLLIPAFATLSEDAGTQARYPDPVSFIPDPWLDDPQRPPSHTPGFAAGG